MIRYEGITRVETYMWPREAFREILLNAVKEKAYETCNPIQIRIYDDRMTIFNEGKWPTAKLPLDKLYNDRSDGGFIGAIKGRYSVLDFKNAGRRQIET